MIRVRLEGNLYRKVVPPGAADITRPGRLGNPYKVQPHGPYTLAESLERHEADLLADRLPVSRAEVRALLDGYEAVACWCPVTEPCHGDALVRLMNEGGAAMPRKMIAERAAKEPAAKVLEGDVIPPERIAKARANLEKLKRGLADINETWYEMLTDNQYRDLGYDSMADCMAAELVATGKKWQPFVRQGLAKMLSSEGWPTREIATATGVGKSQAAKDVAAPLPTDRADTSSPPEEASAPPDDPAPADAFAYEELVHCGAGSRQAEDPEFLAILTRVCDEKGTGKRTYGKAAAEFSLGNAIEKAGKLLRQARDRKREAEKAEKREAAAKQKEAEAEKQRREEAASALPGIEEDKILRAMRALADDGSAQVRPAQIAAWLLEHGEPLDDNPLHNRMISMLDHGHAIESEPGIKHSLKWGVRREALYWLAPAPTSEPRVTSKECSARVQGRACRGATRHGDDQCWAHLPKEIKEARSVVRAELPATENRLRWVDDYLAEIGEVLDTGITVSPTVSLVLVRMLEEQASTIDRLIRSQRAARPRTPAELDTAIVSQLMDLDGWLTDHIEEVFPDEVWEGVADDDDPPGYALVHDLVFFFGQMRGKYPEAFGTPEDE